MTVSNGDIIKAAYECEFANGVIAQNVYHFKAVFIDDQTDSAVLAAIATYLGNLLDSVDQYITDTLTINPCEVDEVQWNATEEQWETVRTLGNTTPSVTFTDTTGHLPLQIAPVLIANTLRPKTRGRKFLPGFCEDTTTGSGLETAVMTALGLALNNYLADETVVGANVLSPGVPSVVTGTFWDFTDGLVDSVVGTQRRRKPGVGA